jgi:hypothetical protein
MRDFLTDLTIWGATLVSRGGDILHYTIPCLLKYCDIVLLMEDNEDEYTHNIVMEYQNKYPDRIRISQSGFRRATENEENNPRGLFHRFKPKQGPIRETVFEYIRNVKRNGEKVDILIWPDEDEIFSDSLKQLLIDFWGMEDKVAITMKPVDVFGDLYTVHSKSMTGHSRIFKPFEKLTAVPYRCACYHHGLTKKNRIGCNRILIHLASLRKDWRRDHWKPSSPGYEKLWKLPKIITEMTPEELRDVFKRESDFTVEEYLKDK